MENLEQFFRDNQRGYPRDPRRMAYAKLQKNTQGMDREQLEAFINANLMIPHSQYKMALGNLIQFLKKQDQMGSLNEVKQLQKLAGLLKETWHPDDPSAVDMDDIEDEDPEDFDDVSEDADYESESGDTNAMGDTDAMNIGEDEAKKKGTLDKKEKIGERLQYAIEEYLGDLGLRELSSEEKPKFQKGLGFTKTTPDDAFMNKLRIGFHFLTPDDDPRRNDTRHDDQEVNYSLRIYRPNERFNINTLRGFITQAKREAKAEGFRFFDKLNRSNQDILFSATIR